MRWLTLERVERSSYFQILLEEWRWDLFPETRHEDNLFIPFVKYPHLGNRQVLAVHLFNRAWLDGGWPSHRHAISHFLSASTTLWRWQEVSNLANQSVYQILVYCHKLFKINFTGILSSSSPVSPHFFPPFRSLSFSLGLYYLNTWNRLLGFWNTMGNLHST